MTRYLKLWPVVAAIAAFVCWKGYQEHLRRDGELREREHALEQRNAKLEDEAGRVDTVYHTDTVRLTAGRRHTDSTLVFITDTVIKARVDTLIQNERAACDAVIQTCEQRVAVRDSIISVKDSLLAVKAKRRPGWFARTFGCTAGLAATPKGAGIGASCGVRIP